MRRVTFPILGDYDTDKQNLSKALQSVLSSFPLPKGEEISLDNLSTGTRIIQHKLRRVPKGIMDIRIPSQAVYTVSSWTSEYITISVTTAGNLKIWVG